ncbi:hypothetical protein [Streptomyces sp. NPDC058695]|uniref:hypothetical protein n=1 Tax=Streptomyces sp. NPDC058695 TaxID=3346604 RepID=UPI00365AF833
MKSLVDDEGDIIQRVFVEPTDKFRGATEAAKEGSQPAEKTVRQSARARTWCAQMGSSTRKADTDEPYFVW